MNQTDIALKGSILLSNTRGLNQKAHLKYRYCQKLCDNVKSIHNPNLTKNQLQINSTQSKSTVLNKGKRNVYRMSVI